MSTTLATARNSLKMASLPNANVKISTDEDLNKFIESLKNEFQEKYNQNKLAESSDRLDDFKFMTILGQGAFGVVVSLIINVFFCDFCDC